ncbi:MAG TPA: ABC transporter permease [Candidatus Limnocylindria bacterium]|nr:ABC transporter permease [Candidatus Limnocylindria bacterium]
MSKASMVIPDQKSLPSIPQAREEITATKAEWMSELWHFRELLYFLAWRDVKVRYKQAAFGAAWAIIQPLFTMLIFTFFFGRMANIPSGGIPYPLFFYTTLVPWTYFAGTLGQGGNSLVSNAPLITKIYFPRILLPASSALSSLLDFGVGSSFLVVMMAYYRVKPSWTLVFWPLAVLEMLLVTLGISMWFAALNVRYRDIKHVIPFMIQLGLWVSPVLYPVSYLSPRWRPLLALNPLSAVMEGFRACIFPSHQLDWKLMATSLGTSLLFFVIGVLYFRKAERTFADII